MNSYSRNPTASKELFKEDDNDILVIQHQIKDLEQTLLKDKEDIILALDALLQFYLQYCKLRQSDCLA